MQNFGGDRPNMQQYKPKAALQRARNLEKIGNMRDACDYLYEVLTSKRMGRIFTPDHEDMMVEFINLCTDLRDTRKTKDGLYFYRQLTQIQNPMSLEKICWHMVNSAEKRASEAKERAAAEAGGAAGGAGAVGSTLEDLEGEADQSPESLLMGAVTVEGTRERVEREILAPWLRHCWDIYRNVIDNVRWVPKLEHLYHAVVIKAMRFCRDYSRNAEFKKLIGMVRGHLAAQRRSQEANGFNMSQEQIERHLTTRFMQLEYCADLSLWVEAFKSVEDIHGIMSLNADVPPKASLMAAYYEKLGRIFWVSQNYLFHAYAWLKFYALSAAQNKSLTEEDKRNLASTVVLAALSIPISGANSSAGLYGGASALASAAAGAGVDVESSERDKKSKLAALLRQSTLPSRDALITEIINRGLLKVVRPEVAQLFRAMEVEFGPLTLIPKCSETLNKLRTETGPTVPSAHGSATAAASHSLSQYVPSLEKLALLRTLQQLSAVYSAISLESFKSLVTSGLSMPYSEIEAMIVRAVRSRIISVRIDHRDNCLKLGNESLEAGNVRRSLTELASRLQSIVEEQKLAAAIKPPTTPLSAIASNPADLEKQRSRLFELARFSSRNDPALAKRRQEEIEKRKQEEERLRQIEAKRQAMLRQQMEEEKAKAEAARMAELEAMRVQKQMEEIKKKNEEDRLRMQLEAAGMDASILAKVTATGEGIAVIDRAALEKEMRDKAIKQKEQELRQRTEQARRLDYLVRALREVERAKAAVAQQKAVEEAKSYVSTKNADTLAKAQEKHKVAIENKAHLAKILPYMKEYEDKILKQRMEIYQKKREIAVAAAKEEHLKRKLERAKKRKEDSERARAERIKAEEERKRAEDAAAVLKARELREAARNPDRGGMGMGGGRFDAPAAVSAADDTSNWRRGAAAAPPPLAAASSGPAIPSLISGASAAASGGWRRSVLPSSEAAPSAAPAVPSLASGSAGAYRPPAARGISGIAASAETQAAASPLAAGAPTGGGWRRAEPSATAAAPAPAPAMAPSSGGYVPPHLRRAAAGGGSADAPAPAPAPAPAAAASSSGGYVPPHLRGRK